jgi:hypothetical protein
MERLINYWKNIGLVERKDSRYYATRETKSYRKDPYFGQPREADTQEAEDTMERLAEDRRKSLQSRSQKYKAESSSTATSSTPAKSASVQSAPPKIAPEQSAPKDSAPKKPRVEASSSAARSTASASKISKAPLPKEKKEPAKAAASSKKPGFGDSILKTRKVHQSEPTATHLLPPSEKQSAPANIPRSNSGNKRLPAPFIEENSSDSEYRRRKTTAKKSRQNSPARGTNLDHEHNRSGGREISRRESATSRSNSPGLFVTDDEGPSTHEPSLRKDKDKELRKFERVKASTVAKHDKRRAAIEELKNELAEEESALKRAKSTMKDHHYANKKVEHSEKRKTISDLEHQLDKDIRDYEVDIASSQSESGTPAPEDRVVQETASSRRRGPRETETRGTGRHGRSRSRSGEEASRSLKKTETPATTKGRESQTRPNIEDSEHPRRMDKTGETRREERLPPKKGVAQKIDRSSRYERGLYLGEGVMNDKGIEVGKNWIGKEPSRGYISEETEELEKAEAALKRRQRGGGNSDR